MSKNSFGAIVIKPSEESLNNLYKNLVYANAAFHLLFFLKYKSKEFTLEKSNALFSISPTFWRITRKAMQETSISFICGIHESLLKINIFIEGNADFKNLKTDKETLANELNKCKDIYNDLKSIRDQLISHFDVPMLDKIELIYQESDLSRKKFDLIYKSDKKAIQLISKILNIPIEPFELNSHDILNLVNFVYQHK